MCSVSGVPNSARVSIHPFFYPLLHCRSGGTYSLFIVPDCTCATLLVCVCVCVCVCNLQFLNVQKIGNAINMGSTSHAAVVFASASA